MPPLLNANAMIKCTHGGMFKIAPTNMTIMAGGAPVLTVADVAAGSFPVSPCPFATAAGPAPCVKLGTVTAGMTTKVMIKGQPALTQAAMFMTIPAGAGSPVPADVVQPGNMTVQGS